MKAASGCHVTGLALRVPYGVSFPYFGAGRGIILKIMRSPSGGGSGQREKLGLEISLWRLWVCLCLCVYVHICVSV